MLREKMDSSDPKFIVLESAIHFMQDSQSRIERTIDLLESKINKRFEDVGRRFDHVDEEIEKTNDRLWSLLFWAIGGFASVLLVVGEAFHWI